jgi:two-component system sensor histidine kinase KdpD
MPSLMRVLRGNVGQIGIGVLVILAVTVPHFFLAGLVGYRSLALLYLLAVACLSLLLNTAAVVVLTFCSALLWIYLFVPPRFSVLGSSLEDTLMFVVYFVTAFATGVLTSRLKSSERMIAKRERRMEFLHDFARSLSELRDAASIAAMSTRKVADHFGGEAVLLLRGGNGELAPCRGCPQPPLSEPELRAARRCCATGSSAGGPGERPPESRFRFAPLATPDSVLGVFGVEPAPGSGWTAVQETDLTTLARTLSISLEREALHEERERMLVERESERLGSILLSTVSHQLRTPLTAIKGAASSLLDEGELSDPSTRRALLGEVIGASERLNSIVENLLSMNRLESGNLRLRRAPVDAQELVSVALAQVRLESGDHPVRTVGVAGGLAISVDLVLMVQVLANILQNAYRYTPPGTPVEVSVRPEGKDLCIQVRDWGPGVTEQELPRLFDRFFRGERVRESGTGLGLSICAGVVQAHGGSCRAFLPEGGGLGISLVIPGAVVEES